MLDAQIVVVQDIIQHKSFAITKTLVEALNTDQEAWVARRVTEWDDNGYGEKEGDMLPQGDNAVLFTQLGRARKIRFEVRIMLGLDPVSEAEYQIAEITGTLGGNIPGKSGGNGGSASSADFDVYSSGGVSAGDEFAPT